MISPSGERGLSFYWVKLSTITVDNYVDKTAINAWDTEKRAVSFNLPIF